MSCLNIFLRFSNRQCLLQSPQFKSEAVALTISHRHKSKRTKARNYGEDNDDESDTKNESDLVSGKGTEIKNSTVGSMRTDLLLKIGLGVSRNKIEQAFYDSRIRVNSKKVLKKSTQVNIGDEVDMVKGVSPTNPEFIIVGRVEVLNAIGRDDDEGIDVRIRRSKSLVIENYPDGHPWKHTDSNNS